MNAMLSPVPVVAKAASAAKGKTLRLLVPTDFSDLAGMAVDTAVHLASLHPGVSLTLVHVVAPRKTPEYPDDVLPFARRPVECFSEAQQRIESLKCRCHPAPHIDTRVLAGDIADHICELAETEHFHAIVLSSHGAGHKPGICIGSVAERVVQCAPCPVLVIKQPPQAGGQCAGRRGIPALRRILVGYDHRRGSKRALAVACAIARETHAAITLVHILEDLHTGNGSPQQADGAARIRQATAWLHQVARRHRSFTSDWTVKAAVGRPSDVLVQFAKVSSSDLIIVGPHEHTRWGHCFVGSTAERTVHLAPCSVLAVK